MPLTATKNAHAYVCGHVYVVKKGEALKDKPKHLQIALANAGVAKNIASKTKEQR